MRGGRRFRTGSTVRLTLAGLVAMFGMPVEPFASEEQAPAAAESATAADPDTSSPETPAERGYRWLTTKAFQPDDFSEAAFVELWRVWPEPFRSQAEGASADERRRMAFSRYGLVEAPGRTGGPPWGAVESGTGWAMNCLACHGGKLAGTAVLGLGNSHYAFQTLFQDLVKYRLDQGEVLKPSEMTGTMVPLGRSNGTTNAQTFSVVLAAMRDRELALHPGQPMPRFANYDLDAPPLWNTKRKKFLYIDGYVAKSSRAIMQFVLVPANTGAQIQAWEENFRDVLAWIESLEAPRYPGQIDAQLAAQGQSAFERVCASCHGTYGPEGEYPELRVPLADVGTDPVRLSGMPIEHRRFMRDSWLGEYGQAEIVEQPEGYVAPPLDGVWASAPYFHNGAVPTLWHVLHPAERPVVWQRSEDGYDHERVGLEVAAFADLPAGTKRPDDKRRYFDTRLTGKSAAGHDFPEQLSAEEQRAVLEYLKTL